MPACILITAASGNEEIWLSPIPSHESGLADLISRRRDTLVEGFGAADSDRKPIFSFRRAHSWKILPWRAGCFPGTKVLRAIARQLSDDEARGNVQEICLLASRFIASFFQRDKMNPNLLLNHVSDDDAAKMRAIAWGQKGQAAYKSYRVLAPPRPKPVLGVRGLWAMAHRSVGNVNHALYGYRGNDSQWGAMAREGEASAVEMVDIFSPRHLQSGSHAADALAKEVTGSPALIEHTRRQHGTGTSRKAPIPVESKRLSAYFKPFDDRPVRHHARRLWLGWGGGAVYFGL